MNKSIDKRGVLDEDAFTYKVTKDKQVFILWHGKHVTTLKARKAEAFIEDIADTEGKESQLIMAKVTGNFKRGNEKPNRDK